jgi:hypothetical protein
LPANIWLKLRRGWRERYEGLCGKVLIVRLLTTGINRIMNSATSTVGMWLASGRNALEPPRADDRVERPAHHAKINQQAKQHFGWLSLRDPCQFLEPDKSLTEVR